VTARPTAVATVATSPPPAAGHAELQHAVPVAAVPADLPGAGRARLRLSFSADSWVDVHDATGHQVFLGKGLANSVKTLGGIAPLKIYLGSAGGVQLEINSRAVAIGRQFLNGNAARFEAGADGVLRRDSAASNGAAARTASPRD
jgi:cytoskeleton protein RodZ